MKKRPVLILWCLRSFVSDPWLWEDEDEDDEVLAWGGIGTSKRTRQQPRSLRTRMQACKLKVAEEISFFLPLPNSPKLSLARRQKKKKKRLKERRESELTTSSNSRREYVDGRLSCLYCTATNTLPAFLSRSEVASKLKPKSERRPFPFFLPCLDGACVMRDEGKGAGEGEGGRKEQFSSSCAHTP